MRPPVAVVVVAIVLAAAAGSGAAFAQSFTDDPVIPGTVVKAVHVTEMRSAIATLRVLVGLQPFTFTDANLTQATIRGIHIEELRTALFEVCDAFPKPRPTFTDPVLAGLPIKAIHIEQLRTAIANIVNDAPSFAKGADQAVNEDAAAQTVVGWATAISAGPREDSQTITFVFDGNDNPGLFSAGPSVAANGTLTYTPATNQNGVAHLSLHAHDDGGTGHGGVDNSASQAFTITVNAINDAPSFTKGADEAVFEDTGLHTVVGWATAISAGPGEGGQTLTFNVTGNTNAALFTVPPAVAANGTLTYTLAANAFGSSLITLTLSDNGGTATGGVDTSGSQSFTITVTGVNDAPSFTKGADQTFDEDSGAHTINGWATAISAGPNEDSQTVSFAITNNTNPGLFSAEPAVSPAGVLTFTSAANQNGTATITLKITDNGGTANGGVDESPTQQFTIIINPVNDAPTVTNKSYPSGAVQANMKIIGLTGLLDGVADVDSGVNGCSPAFTVTNVSATTPAGGTATVNASTGSFDFDPPPGATGDVTFTYMVEDTGCPGTATSAPATVTINVKGPVIWFVDSAGGGPGDGRLSNPFTFLSGNAGVNNDADDVDAANQHIFLYSGAYTGGLTLNDGESLIGQSATGVFSFDVLYGISPPAGTIPRPTLGGAKPSITSSSRGVGLVANNVLNSLQFDDTPGVAIESTANVGVLTMKDIIVNNDESSGGGIVLDDGGSVSHTGVNTIKTLSGIALNVTNTAIIASGLTFQSVAHNGNNTAIVLSNTGPGTLTIAGIGMNGGSGGTIENIVGSDAITLNNTGLVTLKNMIIEDITASSDGTDAQNTRSGVDAISGVNVNGGLTLENTTIRRISDNAILGGTNGVPDVATVWNGLTINNCTIEDTNRFSVAHKGDANDESMIRILGIRGTVTVTNSVLQRGAELLDFLVTDGTLTMTATNNQFLNAYKEFVAADNSPLASVGNHGVDITVHGSSNATITIGDRNNAALGNTFLNGRVASLRVANDAGATGAVSVTLGRNTFRSNDHTSGVLCNPACVSADFDFPQAGVLLASLGTTSSTFNAIVDNNLFDEATNASGGVGQLTLAMTGSVWQALVTNNTFRIPGNAPWFIRADGTTTTAKVKFLGNLGVKGFFNCPDVSCAGGYNGPRRRALSEVQNGGKLDLTIQGDVFAEHDAGFDPGQTFEGQARNVGDPNTLCLNLQNNQAPDGYSLEQFDASQIVNLFRSGGSGICTAPGSPGNCQDALQANGNTGGSNNPLTTPPFVNVAGTVNVVSVACQAPPF